VGHKQQGLVVVAATALGFSIRQKKNTPHTCATREEPQASERTKAMFCVSCGAALEAGARFCGSCGEPVAGGSGAGQQQPRGETGGEVRPEDLTRVTGAVRDYVAGASTAEREKKYGQQQWGLLSV